MVDKLKAVLAQVLEFWNKYSNKQKTLIISIAAGVIVAIGLLWVIFNQVKYEKLDSDVSGKIIYNPSLIDDVTIYINNSENELRQNFSLAHEIAHYIYDIDFSDNKVEIKDSNIFLRSDTVNPIEKRANKYAERLLMPKTLFEAELLTIKDELFPGVKNSELGVKRIYIKN